MQQFNQHTIALSITPEQQEALTNHYDHLLLKLENGRPLTPQLLENLRQAMREVLEAQPKMPGILKAARTHHQLVQLTHEDNTLLNLPWRLAVEDAPNLFLTKGLPTARQNEQALQNPLPLKVLVMISAPEDTHARLSYEEEEDRIIQAFGLLYGHGQVQLDFTEDGSLQNLKRKLKENHYHILHFSGHGTFRDGQGWLELEDELRMEKQLTSAADFAAALNAKPEHCPALVLLSSCQTAQGQKEETFKGVSNRLLEIGVPAIVAMGLSIRDYFATVFASHLYQQLAEKEPLHRAFQSAVRFTQQEEARLLPKQPPSQWMIPQLYTNGTVSDLVDWKADYSPLTFHNYKFITGQHALLLERHEGYQFLGRRKERKQALPLLMNKQPVLLRGQGGVGKTAMAEHLVQRLALQDGSIYPFVFNETTARLEDVIKALQQYLRTEHKRLLIEPETEEYSKKAIEQFSFLIDQVIKVCNPCFVFDNLETFQNEPGGSFEARYSDTKEVIDFLYQNRLCPLLLTGRYPLADFPEATIVNLNQVRYADFFKKCQQLSISDPPRAGVIQAYTGKPPPTFKELSKTLYNSLGGNYRALEFFDELYSQKLGEAVHTLNTLGNYVKNHTGDTLMRMSENLVFQHLLDLADGGQKECLGLMYCFCRPVLPLAIEMQESKIVDEGKALDQLVQLTLLERQVESLDTEKPMVFYYLTPLVKGMLDKVGIQRPLFLEGKAADYFLHTFNHIAIHDFSELEEAWRHYHLDRQENKVNEIGDRLSAYYWTNAIYDLSYFYAQNTSQLLGNNTKVRVFNTLGLLSDHFGDFKTALKYFNKTFEVHRVNNDLEGKATALNNISQVYKAWGDRDKTLYYLKKSLEAFRQIDDQKGISSTLHNLGLAYDAKGEYEKALVHLKKSLKIFESLNDRRSLSSTLGNIGSIYLDTGKYDLAIDHLKKSLKLKRQIEDAKGEAVILNFISRVYSIEGDKDLALAYLEESLTIRQRIGDRAGEGVTLSNIGQIYKSKKNYDRSMLYFKKSLEIRRKIGDRTGEGVILNNMGSLYMAIRDFGSALMSLKQSLKIRQEIGDTPGEGTTLQNLGQLYSDMGDQVTALYYLEQSLEVKSQIGDLLGEVKLLNEVAKKLYVRGERKKSLSYLERSLDAIKRAGHYESLSTAATLQNVGTIYFELGQFDESVLPLMDAYRIRKALNSSKLANTEKYVQLITETLGEARVQEILQQQNQ